MEEKSMEELKDEARSLGLKFKGNVSRKSLEEMIEGFYEADSAGLVAKAEDTESKEAPVAKKPAKESPEVAHRRRMIELRREALATRVVRVSMTDKRENSDVTSYYVHNGPIGKHIPLDVPIELERCLIDQLQRTKVPLHVDDNKGNKAVKMAKKFIVEFIK